MDFDYTDQQRRFRDMVRKFALMELAPGAMERERTGEFDYALYRRLGELGISGMRFPEEYGGLNTDFLSWCLAIEEIARVDLSYVAVLTAAVGTVLTILLSGTQEQKDKWKDEYIVPIAKAEATASTGVTEPNAGSDTAAIEATAVLEGNQWVINGTKAFISNAGLENNRYVIVLVLTDRQKKEFSNILVPKGTPGYRVMPKYRMLGSTAHDLHELAFADCRVPAFNLVGERGAARRLAVERVFIEVRTGVASMAIGVAQASFDAALFHAQQRVAFKKPICKFQFIQSKLVDMALELELSRLLRDKVAVSIDEGHCDRKLASMAKYFCTESAKRAADFAMQIHGAAGLMDEAPVSRYYRQIRPFTIGDGTDDIQKWIIAREIGC